MLENKYRSACEKIKLPQGAAEKMLSGLEEKKTNRKALSLAPVALILAAALMAGFFLLPSGMNNAYAIAVPELPEGGKFQSPREEAKGIYEDWYKSAMKRFAAETLPQVYEDGENLVYSPVSFYYTLAMLSMVTEGDTRDQIISALGAGEQDLYHQIRLMFQKMYWSNARGESKMSASVWLNDDREYNEETLKKLSEQLFAWSYSVPMGTEDADSLMNTWLESACGGLLEGDFETRETDEAMLISSLYFRDLWVDRFDSSKTESGVFHSPTGDVECDFMNMRDISKFYFYGEKFQGTTLQFQNSGSMIIMLPDEGCTVEDILNDPEAIAYAIDFRSDNESFGRGSGEVILSIPRFTVDSELNLTDAAKNLGISDAFDSLKADFTPISERETFVSGVKQSAKLSIDEKGCEAGVYTSIELVGAAPPNGRVELILNRPFVFMITSQRMPLFIGVVNDPNG